LEVIFRGFGKLTKPRNETEVLRTESLSVVELKELQSSK